MGRIAGIEVGLHWSLAIVFALIVWTLAGRIKGARNSLRTALGKLGVLYNKHIPPAYLRASRDDRLALLQGLMDSDGSVSGDGMGVFTNTNGLLIDGVLELLSSLGCRAMSSRRAGSRSRPGCSRLR